MITVPFQKFFPRNINKTSKKISHVYYFKRKHTGKHTDFYQNSTISIIIRHAEIPFTEPNPIQRPPRSHILSTHLSHTLTESPKQSSPPQQSIYTYISTHFCAFVYRKIPQPGLCTTLLLPANLFIYISLFLSSTDNNNNHSTLEGGGIIGWWGEE